jgi:hypothetical protein
MSETNSNDIFGDDPQAQPQPAKKKRTTKKVVKKPDPEEIIFPKVSEANQELINDFVKCQRLSRLSIPDKANYEKTRKSLIEIIRATSDVAETLQILRMDDLPEVPAPARRIALKKARNIADLRLSLLDCVDAINHLVAMLHAYIINQGMDLSDDTQNMITMGISTLDMEIESLEERLGE